MLPTSIQWHFIGGLQSGMWLLPSLAWKPLTTSGVILVDLLTDRLH
jgi:hypothetical protein